MERFFLSKEDFLGMQECCNERGKSTLPYELFCDENGFLKNDAFFGKYKTFSEVIDSGNAIIIAECGMGKTYVLKEFMKSVPLGQVKKIDLILYESNLSSLESEISNIGECKYLLVDGVDEAPSCCQTLTRVLGESTLENVRVVVASRNIKQLIPMNNKLKWNEYFLLPYTKENVNECCQLVGKDFNFFISEVNKLGFGCICAKPISCNFLLDSFDGIHFNTTSVDQLWENSIKILCGENASSSNHNYKDDSEIVTTEMCFEIAMRIAVVLKLSGTSIVTEITETTKIGVNELDFSKIIECHDFRVFNKCLSRPLFTPVDNNKFKFSHTLYLDFLAAKGMIRYIKTPLWSEIMLSNNKEPYPQWEGVVGWIMAKDDDILNNVKSQRPDLLLLSEYVVRKVNQGEICRLILEKSKDLPLDVLDSLELKSRYRNLNSDECVCILSETLESDKPEVVLETAINIVRHARLKSLKNNLIDIFCNPNKSLDLRIHAGYALIDLAENSQLNMCESILYPQMSSRLKGIALQLLWPHNMTVDQLIPLLISPKDYNVIDSYKIWLRYVFPFSLKSISESSRYKLLNWAIEDVMEGGWDNWFYNEAKICVFLYCWQVNSTSEELELLVKGLEAYTNIHVSPFDFIKELKGNVCFDKNIIEDYNHRRMMSIKIVENTNLSIDSFVNNRFNILRYDDIDFIIDKVKNTNELSIKHRWAECLYNFASYMDLEHYGKIWIYLHDKKYIKLQKNQERKEELKNNREKGKYYNNISWVKEKIKENDIVNNFYSIVSILCCRFDSGWLIQNYFFIDSVLSIEFTEEEIDKIVEGAHEYILGYNNLIEKRNDDNRIVVNAFCLIMFHNSSKLNDIPLSIWEDNISKLVESIYVDDNEFVVGILKYFVGLHPDVFVQTFTQLLSKQLLSENGYVNINNFKWFFDESNNIERVLETLDEDSLTGENRNKLYEKFWFFDNKCTSKYIRLKWENNLSVKCCNERYFTFLFASMPVESISLLLQYLRMQQDSGISWCLENIGNGNCIISSSLSVIPPTQLMDFYELLSKIFPPENEPKHYSGYSPQPIDYVYDFIRSILSDVYSRVDSDVPKALENLLRRNPEMEYLRYYIDVAKRRLLKEKCPIYDIKIIDNMLKTNDFSSVVNTIDDLMNVVINCLKEIENDLKSVNIRLVRFIWNEEKNGDFSPKKEEDFSDLIAHYLRQRLPRIVINREVQLSQRIGDIPGARTDIFITAISEKKERLSLCIEIKGSWNRTCKTSFADQLCNRYMDVGGAEAGIFLVGWFYTDRIEKKPVWNSKDEAVSELQLQEQNLIASGFNVKSFVVDCSI